ncbi:MAG: hypothetical protein A2885_22160 [Sphingopyxis sp. RIFCSPHIGHO2_01_FULL_65_24]|nr:MAG: hypothetical protein A2885_22160 [Sphingopyxis sp. RIFCSPHIGHO2_01_FULL_65_24]
MLISEIAGSLANLRQQVQALREETRLTLRRPLALHARQDPGVLDALARFIATLAPDSDDDPDDADVEDEDDEEVVPLQGRRAAEAAFTRAVRNKAMADASKRALPRTS